MSAASFFTAIPAAADRAAPAPRPEPRTARADNPARDDRPAFRDELDRAAQTPAPRPGALDERTPRASTADDQTADSATDTAERPGPDDAPQDVDVDASVDVDADTDVTAAADLDQALPVDPVAAQADELVASLAGLAQTLRDAQRGPGPAPQVDEALATTQTGGQPVVTESPATIPVVDQVATPITGRSLDLAGGAVQAQGLNLTQPAGVDPAAQELTTAADATPQTAAGVLNSGASQALPGLGFEVATAAPTTLATPAADPAATSAAATASRPATAADRGLRGAANDPALGLAPGTANESTDAAPSAEAAARTAAPGAAAAALPSAPGAGAEALAGDTTLRPAGLPTAAATSAGLGAGAQELADADAEADGLNATRLSRALNSAVKQNGGGLTLRLTPAALGTVRIDLQLQGASVSADFVAESEAGGRLLNRQLVQLRSALESQGLTVERLGVQVKGQAFTGGSGPQTDGQSGRQDQTSDQARSNGSDAGGGQSRGRERSDAEAEARRGAPLPGRNPGSGEFSRLFGEE